MTPAEYRKREPVRALATTPVAVLGLAAAVSAFGVGEPLQALAVAVVLVVLCALLEVVRARVTPINKEETR